MRQERIKEKGQAWYDEQESKLRRFVVGIDATPEEYKASEDAAKNAEEAMKKEYEKAKKEARTIADKIKYITHNDPP